MSLQALKIGFLATGDEITTGEIVNSNTPYMSQELFLMGFKVGMHLSVRDDLSDLVSGLCYLLLHHDIVITVGGLGPTEDDLTSEAIASVLKRPLTFCEMSWQRIVDRLSKRYVQIPENNRKQAYFAEGAKVLENPLGTADAAYWHLSEEGSNKKEKYIFMLPGPPKECLPLFTAQIMPRLIDFAGVHNVSGDICISPYFYRWKCLGMPEAKVSGQLQPIAEKHGVTLGYRADFPYTDVKCVLMEDNMALIEEVEVILKDSVASKTQQLGSECLYDYLKVNALTLKLQKDATKGYLLSHFHLNQMHDSEGDLLIKTEGLTNIHSEAVEDVFGAEIIYQGEIYKYQVKIPRYVNNKLLFNACLEWLSLWILKTVGETD